MDILLGQCFELAVVFIRKLLPLNLTVEQVKDLIQNKDHPFWTAFEKCIDTLRVPFDVPVGWTPEAYASAQKQIAWWKEFYGKQGIELDGNIFSIIPIPPPNWKWLVIVAKGMTMDIAYEMCRSQFGASKYWDGSLDVAITKNDRDPANGTYAVWFRNRVEADDEMKNLSANQLKENNVKGITLLERLLLELKCFSETKKHLDIANWTLCSGSRISGGFVPNVGWHDSKLRVHWSFPDYSCGYLRSRVAVR